MPTIRFGVVFFTFFATISIATGNTDKMDNTAVSQFIALGNRAVNLFLRDEAYFNVAADIAYTAYL